MNKIFEEVILKTKIAGKIISKLVKLFNEA